MNYICSLIKKLDSKQVNPAQNPQILLTPDSYYVETFSSRGAASSRKDYRPML